MSTRSKPVTETLGGRLVLALAAMAAIMTIQAIVGASPAAAITERPGDTDMTNGEVYATALSEDGETLYIGGKFNRVKDTRPGGSTVGRAVKNVAAIDVDSGTLVQTWRPQVTEHVTGDGAVVRSLAEKDGVVYIGGNFTAVRKDESSVLWPRKNLAAVHAKSGSVVGFAPRIGGDTSYVFALETDGIKLYVGGGFSKVSEDLSGEQQPRKNLAAFRLANRPENPGALDPDWKPATSVAETCTDPKCSSKVRALEFRPNGTSIFVGGSFSRITGSDGAVEDRQSVARVHTDTGNLHPWKIPTGTIEGPQTAWALTATANRLYGGFGGGSANFLAAFRLDRDDSGPEDWRRSARGNVQAVALAPDGSRLFYGGHFGINGTPTKRVCGGKPLRGLASVNPETGVIRCDFIPSLDQNHKSYDGAWALITTPSHLWVGGGFIGVSDSINPRDNAYTRNPEVHQTNLARFRL